MGWVNSLSALISRLLSGPRSFTDQMPLEDGGGGLRSAWRSWQEMPLDEAGAVPAPSADLSDLNRRLSAIFRDYFQNDELGPQAADDLAHCQKTLARLVPTLSGTNRQYFAMASSIARGILEASGIPDSSLIEAP